MNMKIHTTVIFLLGLFLSAGCQSTSTPQAQVFDTLKAAAAGIDAYRSSVEAARAQGMVSDEQWADFAARYNRANEAIIVAAKLLRDVGGLDTGTPAEVDAAIASLVELVTTIIPPKGKVTP